MTRPSPAALLQYMCNPIHTTLGTKALRLLGAPAVAQPPPVDLRGQTVLVTGGTAGIGRAIAAALAASGAEVHITGRSVEAGEAAARELGAAFHRVDHSDLAQVRRFAKAFLEETLGGRALDTLVNNAAFMPNGFSRTAEGHEQAVALNLLGMYALTRALLPSLERSRADAARPGGRVVNVTSAGMLLYSLDVADLAALDGGLGGWAETYDAVCAYSLTHRARVLLTKHWGEEAQRAKGGGEGGPPARVRFSSVHPGWVETPGLAGADAMRAFYKLTRPVLRSPAEGADTPVFLAAGMDALEASASAAPNGSFWYDRAPRTINLPLARTAEPPEQLARLLEFCEARTAE